MSLSEGSWVSRRVAMVGSREGAGVVVGEVMFVVGGCVCVC